MREKPQTLTLLLAAALLVPAAMRAGGIDAAERARRVEQVRAAEIAFSRSVETKDRDAFVAAIDPDAVFVGGQGVTVGLERIVEEWAGFFGADSPQFSWRPELVELSGDGELALSRGTWSMKGKGPDGAPFERGGIFNSTWRRQADGGWKVVFDAGCDPCPVCPARP